MVPVCPKKGAMFVKFQNPNHISFPSSNALFEALFIEKRWSKTSSCLINSHFLLF